MALPDDISWLCEARAHSLNSGRGLFLCSLSHSVKPSSNHVAPYLHVLKHNSRVFFRLQLFVFKVELAEMHGVAGILLYPDPQDYRGKDSSSFLRQPVQLPSDSIVMTNAKLIPGDPETPNTPSTGHIFFLSYFIYIDKFIFDVS